MTAERRDGPPPTIHGYEFGVVISCLQKACRRCEAEAAAYWAVELERSGFGAACWRRLLIIASEDVGLAQPGIAAEVQSLFAIWTELRKKREDRAESWRLATVHAALLLARSRKDRAVDHCLLYLYASDEVREVPDHALDRHTAEGRRKRRGAAHFFDVASLLVDPETGELAPSDDPYLDRARAATGAIRPERNEKRTSGRITSGRIDAPAQASFPATTESGTTDEGRQP